MLSQSIPPSAAAARASPIFHLDDFTNWKTPQR